MNLTKRGDRWWAGLKMKCHACGAEGTTVYEDDVDIDFAHVLGGGCVAYLSMRCPDCGHYSMTASKRFDDRTIYDIQN